MTSSLGPASCEPRTSHLPWSLVEVCAGGAALTLHLLGAKHALLPYQGSKWKIRRELEKLLRDHGVRGPPSTVWLNDAGPFGRTWLALSSAPSAVSLHLGALEKRDPREVYDSLHGSDVPAVDASLFAAEHLFLQRLSHSGKAVTVKRGWWSSPGFNKTSAYGKEATDQFGPIKPMIPHLIRTVQETGELLQKPKVICSSHDVRSFRDLRTPFHDLVDSGDPVVFFVDPPYRETTGYGTGLCELDRIGLVGLVRRLLQDNVRRPVLVVVCEAEPVFELMGTGLGDQGFMTRVLREPTGGKSPFRSTSTEVVTFLQTPGWVKMFGREAPRLGPTELHG